MELTGKKVAFLGDSITEGVGVSSHASLYWQRIAQETGAQCFGYGISGTRIAPQKGMANQQSLRMANVGSPKNVVGAGLIIISQFS